MRHDRRRAGHQVRVFNTLKKELGSNWEIAAWRVIAAPKGLPADIQNRLATSLKKVHDSKEFRDFYEWKTPETTGKHIWTDAAPQLLEPLRWPSYPRLPLRLEDKKGEEFIYIRAEKDTIQATENDYGEWVGHDRLTTVGNDETAWGYRHATWAQVVAGVDPDPANAGAIT